MTDAKDTASVEEAPNRAVEETTSVDGVEKSTKNIDKLVDNAEESVTQAENETSEPANTTEQDLNASAATEEITTQENLAGKKFSPWKKISAKLKKILN